MLLNPKVSIITPIYNASHFIGKCAESLFNQTFDSIEFVFIDDASTDNSIKILESSTNQYPLRKESIIIERFNKNRGPGAAKQRGIDLANGEYISFIDADDYIDHTMIETMYLKAIAENADIVVCDLFLEFKDRKEYIKDYVFDDFELRMREMFRNEKSQGFLVNKLIRKHLMISNQVFIPCQLRYLEDLYLITQLYYFANKIVKIDQAFYHYVKYNPKSTTKGKNILHFESFREYWRLQDIFQMKHNISHIYKEEIQELKVRTKLILMFDTISYRTRKRYASLFQEEEISLYNKLRFSEKLMILALRKKLYLISIFISLIIKIKNKKF